MHFSIPELLRIAEENKTSPIARLAKFSLGRAVLDIGNTLNGLLMDHFPGLEELNLKRAKVIKDRLFTLFLSLQMHRLYLAVERLNKVTIAAINGPCNGGGTEFAACFDFRFMVGDQGFTIGQPEVLVGIIAGGGRHPEMAPPPREGPGPGVDAQGKPAGAPGGQGDRDTHRRLR